MTKIKARESQNVEYKSSWHDEYLKWICGFANAQGAVMYFGVDNDHEVVGLENVDRLMEDIPNKIVTTMGIVVDVNLLEQDGLEYIEVVIAFRCTYMMIIWRFGMKESCLRATLRRRYMDIILPSLAT